MIIFDLLKEDHAKVRSIYQKLQTITSPVLEENKRLFNLLRKEIVLHSRAEEKCFYQPITKHKAAKSQIEHATQEHRQVKDFLDVLEEMIHVGEEIAQQGEGFFSTLEALIKALEHHIKEEEDEIFETAELFFTTPQLKQMGEEFIQEKRRIEKEMQDQEKGGE